MDARFENIARIASPSPPPGQGWSRDRVLPKIERSTKIIEIQQSAKIGRPVGEVFAFVGDLGNWPRWQPQAEGESPPGGLAKVGTTFRQTFDTSGGRVDLLCRVTGYEQDRKLSLSYTRQDASFAIDFLFEPGDGGTNLTAVGDGRLSGFYGLFEPLVGDEVNARIGSSLADLKALLEAGD